MASLWEDFGSDDASKRARLVSEPFFGPFDEGSRVWLRLGQLYRITPMCQGTPKWENTITPVIDARPYRTVNC